MKRSSLLSRLIPCAPFAVVVLLWVALSESGTVKDAFLPSIQDVFGALGKLFLEDEYHKDVAISIVRVVGAFIASVCIAVPGGLCMGFFPRFSDMMRTFIYFNRYLPIPAFVPLCILWFGLGDQSKIFIIFLGTVFQLAIMVADCADKVQQQYYEAALTLGASRRQLFTKILIPASFPDVVLQCRTAIGLAWTYLIVAEVAGATQGLGFKIVVAQRYIQTPKIFAGIVVIGLLGIFTDLLFKFAHGCVVKPRVYSPLSWLKRVVPRNLNVPAIKAG